MATQSSLFSRKIKEEQKQKNQIQIKIAEENIRPTNDEQQYVDKIISDASKEFFNDISGDGVTAISAQLKDFISKEASELKIPYEQQKRVEKIAVSTVIGYGPITRYLDDPSVSEIVVQRYDNICIEKQGTIHNVKETFLSERHLQNTINRIVQKVGRQINLQNPIVDARLLDGSRVNATIPPVSPDGATLCIRKFNNAVLTGENYIELGSIDPKMLYFLEKCVLGKLCILVSGGTGTGKTTLLNMLSLFIPDEELIVTIEDSCELKLHQHNIRRMETRTSLNANQMQVDTQVLVKNALRMRPDRLIVGEIRDGSVVDMISAMSTGHDGSLSTVHANSPENLVNTRLPILFGMNKGVSFSEQAQFMQISEAIQIIVQISRFPDGSRKITNITHVDGLMPDGHIRLHDIFIYDKQQQKFRATGYIPKAILSRFAERGLKIDPSIFEV